MFGLAKCKANLPLGLEVDSHQHDQMNFSHPKVANATTLINQLLVVDVGETNNPNHVIIHNGVEVLECLYGDGIWQFECCPPTKVTLVAWCCKKTLNIIVKPKSFQNKKIMVFMLRVMLATSL